MGIPLRVLVIEDSEDDALLLVNELRRGGYDPTFERVDTPAAMTDALDRQTWDIVLADYVMPQFSAPAALTLLQRTELDLPFIVVSGKIGEETAVATMKAGAHDYLMKDNLTRLASAIERELREAEERRERKRAEEALQKAHDELEHRVEERTLELRSLVSELSLAEERERSRIAADLHDRISQPLAVAKISLGSLVAEAPDSDLAQSLQEIRELVDRAIRDTRSLLFEISHPVLYELGLEAGIEWLMEQFQEQHDLPIHLDDDGQEKPVEEPVGTLLFQAVRELLTNVVKHAQAHCVRTSIRRTGDNLRIEVEDDGIGFEGSERDAHTEPASGFGLLNIRVRMEHLGGGCRVDTQPGRGTRVTLVAPLKQDGEPKQKGRSG